MILFTDLAKVIAIITAWFCFICSILYSMAKCKAIMVVYSYVAMRSVVQLYYNHTIHTIAISYCTSFVTSFYLNVCFVNALS